MANNKTQSEANVICLYSTKICKDAYDKIHMMFILKDISNENRYVWITTASSHAASELIPGKQYKIKFTIDQTLSPNDHKITRVNII